MKPDVKALKKNAQAKWQSWCDQFSARPTRERAILAGVLIFGGGFLLFSFGIDAASLKTRAMRTEITTTQTELLQQQAQLAALQTTLSPDAANQKRLSELKSALNEVNSRLNRFEQGMVSPSRMQGFLEDLLARHRSIELLELKTLPPHAISAQVKKSDTAANPQATPPTETAPLPPADGIWQHGIELRLAGNYPDLLNYLTGLESMPQRLMWNSINLTVEKYPRNVLTLRVYTLSLDKDWLVM